MKTTRTLCATLALLGSLSALLPAAETVILPAGSVWSYLDDGSDQAAAWRLPAFDDSAWQTGAAQLGYGESDEATVVGFGPDPDDKYVTTYFRHTFNVADPGVFLSASARVLRDDGVVIYLNGTEIFRNNIPAGEPGYRTYANSTVSGGNEGVFLPFSVPETLLVAGDNVIAAEIHQAAANSSDISFDLEVTASDEVVIVRGPYLQTMTPSSVIVRWRTNAPDDAGVWYGTAPDQLDTFVPGGGAVAEKIVAIGGLSHSTDYWYAIGDSPVQPQAESDAFFRTPPPPGTRQPVRIWAIGDSGTGNANAAAVRDAFDGYNGSRYVDVWLMLGDNAYVSGTDAEYQSAVFDIYPSRLRQSALWSAYGNHDGYSADSATQTGPYYDIFSFPRSGEAGGAPSGTEAYYSFDHANIHFVCLDSYESSRAADGAMLVWLNDDLEASAADWTIAFWHHPPYSKGSHNSDAEIQLIEMRTNALPVLEMHGVDLVLCGHSHSYERSYLLGGHYGTSDTLDPSMILDGGDGDAAGDGSYTKTSAPVDGAVYVVAGSSGGLTAGTLDHPAMLRSSLTLGSLAIDVDGLSLDARFLTNTGATLDAFSMVKTDDSARIEWNAP